MMWKNLSLTSFFTLSIMFSMHPRFARANYPDGLSESGSVLVRCYDQAGYEIICGSDGQNGEHQGYALVVTSLAKYVGDSGFRNRVNEKFGNFLHKAAGKFKDAMDFLFGSSTPRYLGPHGEWLTEEELEHAEYLMARHGLEGVEQAASDAEANNQQWRQASDVARQKAANSAANARHSVVGSGSAAGGSGGGPGDDHPANEIVTELERLANETSPPERNPIPDHPDRMSPDEVPIPSSLPGTECGLSPESLGYQQVGDMASYYDAARQSCGKGGQKRLMNCNTFLEWAHYVIDVAAIAFSQGDVELGSELVQDAGQMVQYASSVDREPILGCTGGWIGGFLYGSAALPMLMPYEVVDECRPQYERGRRIGGWTGLVADTFNTASILTMEAGFLTGSGGSGALVAVPAMSLAASCALAPAKYHWDAISQADSYFSRSRQLQPGGSFRENLVHATGRNPKDEHAHHVFPREFEEEFWDRFKISINNPRYGTWWDASRHLSASKEYNMRWAEFLERPNLDAKQVFDFARDLADLYGFDIYF